MKKLLTLFIIGIFGFSLFAVSMPVYASQKGKSNYGQEKKEIKALKTTKAKKLQNLVAFVTGVDLQAKTVSVRKSAAVRSVLADNAVVMIVTDDGAKLKTLADLKVGEKAIFLVKKQRGPKWTYNAVLIIQDLSIGKDDSSPLPKSERSVQFSSASGSGSESVTPVSIPLTLSSVTDEDVKVTYTVTGTAVGGGVDFTLASGVLTLPKGQTTVSLSLAVANDELDELDETVVVTLSSPENAMLGPKKVYTYTIIDNDQPSVGFNASGASTVENVTAVTIPVTLLKASTHEVKVKYTVTGSATGGGVDYTLANGELTFAAGTTSKDLALTVTDDTTDEPDETVVITLSDPNGATLGSSSVYTHTVLDND